MASAAQAAAAAKKKKKKKKNISVYSWRRVSAQIINGGTRINAM